MENEELFNEAKEFLEENKSYLSNYIKQSKLALEIDFERLLNSSPNIANMLIDKPEETLKLLEMAAIETQWIGDKKIRFLTLPNTQSIKIRNLRSKHLGKMVSIEGVIRQASEVRPQVTNAKFECPSCGTIISVLQIDKEKKEPNKCSCGRSGGFKEISKDMIDSQIIVLEESPDSLDIGGDQPKRIKVLLFEDLTDPKMERRVIPGNKVKIIGVLNEIELSGSKKPLVRYDIAIKANNIVPLEDDIDDVEITEEDEIYIKEISKRSDLFNYLSKSVAPSIWGHEDVKKALTLQLFGGVRRKRTDGSHCREQIHGLLVGDPGVAKSVILKYLTGLAHKSRYVSGKSASGVGLTATATRDEMTKSWVLEAGAMVLANNGHLFIDEFEKMTEEDRSNLHEGMSMGTISVAKASIQATLSARTSILAAANPKMGRFDNERPIAEQINLIPSLLSRFDFIFVMRDIPEEERDLLIAGKIFEEHDDNKVEDILDKEMFRKYIAYSRGMKPKISKEASERLKNYYVGLRKRAKRVEGKRVIPIGARQLEGLIRFSEASAKLHLRKEVLETDAELAISVMESYLKEVGYDEENKTFDIDKITGNSTSQRSKIDVLFKVLKQCETEFGKNIPIDEIKKKLEDKFTESEFDDYLNKIVRSGDAFRPMRGMIQLL
jgi:replicative DNA helicase Mcm